MESELNDYINVYIESIYDYIEHVRNLEISSKTNRRLIESNGFRAITNVFQLKYIYTNSLVNAFNSCKHATACYIEYIEQINKNSGVDYSDASAFIYNKLTINDFSKSTPIVNYTISNVSKLVDTLFWWDNLNIDQSVIRRETVMNFACLSGVDFLNSYIEIAQHRDMDTQTYIEFLNETYKLIKKRNDLLTVDNETWMHEYIAKRSKWDEHVNMPIKKWCKWLFI
jgi:hypothetical protein